MESNQPRQKREEKGEKKITYLTDAHRLLPQSDSAEQGVLGSMLIAPSLVCEFCVEKGVGAHHFYSASNSSIYQVIIELWGENKPIDLILLTQALRDRNLLESVGGVFYITSLFTFVPTAANANYYIDIVIEKYTLRQIILTSTEYTARAYDDQDEVPYLLDEFESKVLAIRRDLEVSPLQYSNATAIMEVMEQMEWMISHKGEISGLSTGFVDLDKKTNGLQPDQMIVLAARPSMGKTALATNIAEHVALYLKKPVAIFSLEMSRRQLLQRLICSLAKINLEQFIAGNIPDAAFPKITEAASKIRNAPLYISDDMDRSIETIKARARRIKREKNIQLMIIDYLQLLTARSLKHSHSSNRNQELSFISNEIKALVKELHIPIIVIAALNRDPEKRGGGKPRLSDLRECGVIEYDGDLIMLISRPEVYAESEEEQRNLEGEAYLDIAKNKMGSTGDVPLTFLKEWCRFEDRAHDVR